MSEYIGHPILSMYVGKNLLSSFDMFKETYKASVAHAANYNSLINSYYNTIISYGKK